MSLHGIKKWVAIALFFSALSLDWTYTYSLTQDMAIITHWVILSPVLMTLFFILGLFSAGGIYLSQWWGFAGCYLVLIFSSYFAFLSYAAMHNSSTFYFSILIIMNIAVFFYIVLYEIHSWSDKPKSLNE